MRFILQTKTFKVEDSIIIAGEPRSGTTWLLDLLLSIPNTFAHCEPLHQENGVLPKEYKWGDRIFIQKNDTDPFFIHLFKNILRGKKYNTKSIWFKEQSIFSLIKSKVLITKFVRANLLLSYITTNFKLKSKPILIIRHPVDTCLSQMSAFEYNRVFPREIPDWLNNERYIEEQNYLESLSTVLEYNIAMWCLNNCPLLEDKLTLPKLNIIFYSDLLISPEKEIRVILNSLSSVKKSNIDNIIRNMNFRRASNTDFKQNFIPNPEKQLNKNIARLTQNEKIKIQQIFDHFNFDLYNAYSVFPSKEYLK